ncbi:hypothetical protein Tco_0715380 [Tanacetum coccineum]
MDHLLNLNNTQLIYHQYLIQSPIPPIVIKPQFTITFSHHHLIPQIDYSPHSNQQLEFSQLARSDFTVFKHGDDTIDASSCHSFLLLLSVPASYTNNHLRNSSNRQQATINEGRVTIQPVQGRQISYAAGEGHMSKQCTKPRRKQDDSWFKDKVLLVQAQASGQILHEEELAFLADPGIPEVDLMANLSHYGSDALAEVHNHDNVNNKYDNQVVQTQKKPSNTYFKLDMFHKTELSAEQDFWSKNSVNSPEPTLSSRPTKVEVPKELPKVSMVNTSLKKLKYHLASFAGCKERTTPQLSLRPVGEKVLVITTLEDDLRKLKGKAIVDNKVTKHLSDPDILKIDVEPITPKLLNKQTAHSAYIKHTQEETIVLRDLVEHVKSKYPLRQSLRIRLLFLGLMRSFELKYVKCKVASLSANHDLCVLDFINNVNAASSTLFSAKLRNDNVGKDYWVMEYLSDWNLYYDINERVYYVEGLGHNLFSVGQFCDSNLEVAFRQHTCFIRNLEGVDLLTGYDGQQLLHSVSGDLMASSPIVSCQEALKD